MVNDMTTMSNLIVAIFPVKISIRLLKEVVHDGPLRIENYFGQLSVN